MYRKEYNPWGSLKHLEGHPFKGYSEKLFVINGDSNFADVKDTPFGWLPASRVFPSFDAVICTDKYIITIQLTVSSEHSMSPEGWCHVFVTDCERNPTLLREQKRPFAF